MSADDRPEQVPRLRTSGLLRPGEPHVRHVLHEELYAWLPKDAEARVQVYNWEIGPGGKTAWHIHNGAAFMIVTEGRIAIEFKDKLVPYEAGDVYPEPIGVLHRGTNLDAEHPVSGFAFIVTPPGREHVVNVKEPW